MIDMVVQSSKLFFAGKLFQDNKLVIRQFVIGTGAGVASLVAVGQFAPLWAAAAAGGGVAGFLMPILFKNLKYA